MSKGNAVIVPDRILNTKGRIGTIVVVGLSDTFFEITIQVFYKVEADTLGIANTIRNYRGIGNDRHHILGERVISVVELMIDVEDKTKYFQEMFDKINL